MDQVNIPKVLIINQPFNNNTGGGITLSNLFADWGKELLAVACSGYMLVDVMDAAVCNNYYQLGSKERKWIFPLNLVRHNYYSGPLRLTDKSKEHIVKTKSKTRVKLILDFVLPVFDYIGLSHFQSKLELSTEFKKWLDDFNPDIIYMQASNLADIRFCLKLKKYLKRPLIFHMMDDWPSTIANKGFMKNYWGKKINTELKKLLEHADVAMSISEYMAEEYKRRYNKDFITFHNPIDLDFWKSAQRNEYNLSSRITLLYAGRVGLGIDSSLKVIAQAVELANRDLECEIKFALQTPKAPNWIKNYNCVEHRSFVNYQDLPKVFAEADFLILPYDFSNTSLSFIKYSMPTKAPEYMASGTPILIFAPRDTALVRYAEKLGWAVCVTDNKVEILTNAIKEFIQKKEKRHSIAQNAVHIAEQIHNSKTVSVKFKESINSVIS